MNVLNSRVQHWSLNRHSIHPFSYCRQNDRNHQGFRSKWIVSNLKRGRNLYGRFTRLLSLGGVDVAREQRKDVLWKIAVVGGVFAILIGVAVASILYRSQDIEIQQTVYPLSLTVSPNPFPDIGLDADGSQNFTFELTASSSNQNPDLALTAYVIPSPAENLTIQHCLENSQTDLSGLNSECDQFEWHSGQGEYYANVTSGSSVVLRVQVLFSGPINEPTPLTWVFYAEGVEIP